MPRFYMHVRSVSDFTADFEGREFATLGEAHAAAIQSARRLMKDAGRVGKFTVVSEYEIADETGRLLLTVPFSEAIQSQ